MASVVIYEPIIAIISGLPLNDVLLYVVPLFLSVVPAVLYRIWEREFGSEPAYISALILFIPNYTYYSSTNPETNVR